MKKIYSQATLEMPPITIHSVQVHPDGGIVLHIEKGNQPTEQVRMYLGDRLTIDRKVSVKVTESPNEWRS